MFVVDTRLFLPVGQARPRKEAHAATASISRTHSQCQRWGRTPVRGRSREDLVFIPGEYGGAAPLARQRWWSQPGSNRRPQACKASALPTELWPRHNRKLIKFTGAIRSAVVGRGGVEPPTSRLSGVRSNHLSYRPPRPAGQKAAGGVSQLRHSPYIRCQDRTAACAATIPLARRSPG